MADLFWHDGGYRALRFHSSVEDAATFARECLSCDAARLILRTVDHGIVECRADHPWDLRLHAFASVFQAFGVRPPTASEYDAHPWPLPSHGRAKAIGFDENGALRLLKVVIMAYPSASVEAACARTFTTAGAESG